MDGSYYSFRRARGDVLRSVVLAIALFGLCCSETRSPGKCWDVKDCEDEAHPNCEGTWQCVNRNDPWPGDCRWQCVGQGYCSSPSDCESQEAVVLGCDQWTWRCENQVCVADCLAANPDLDRDGLPDENDPCPLDPDNDADKDGLCGNVDNCSALFNPDQEDSDQDGLGDPCDPDHAVRAEVIEESDDHIVVRFSVHPALLPDKMVVWRNGTSGPCAELVLPGTSTDGFPGLPGIPVKTTKVLLPFNTVEVSVVDVSVSETDSPPAVAVSDLCVPEGPPEADSPFSPPTVPVYPSSHVSVSGVMVHKTVKYAEIRFYPILLGLADGALLVAQSATLRIDYHFG